MNASAQPQPAFFRLVRLLPTGSGSSSDVHVRHSNADSECEATSSTKLRNRYSLRGFDNPGEIDDRASRWKSNPETSSANPIEFSAADALQNSPPMMCIATRHVRDITIRRFQFCNLRNSCLQPEEFLRKDSMQFKGASYTLTHLNRIASRH
jgi:hypothetical protein